MRPPKVSVIIPTRNRLESLRCAIDSVLNQTEQDFELIVVDDGSTDGTRAYLENLATAEPRAKPRYNDHPGGGAAARNVGISVSSGRWTAFLDDDDEWLPNKLTMQLATLAQNPGAIACSTSYFRRRSSGKTKLVAIPDAMSFSDLLLGSVLGGASMCICDSVHLKKIGGYDPTFRSGQDWDLWTRLSQVGKIVSCKSPTVVYSVHEGPRISNDMLAQYQGARRYYFKYKPAMTYETRTHRLAYLLYIMSRQRERGIRSRARYLILAMFKSRFRVAVGYMASSLPRLCRDSFARAPINY